MLKTTGSSFSSFIRDEYTTLAEVTDRIFSTSVDVEYRFKDVGIFSPLDEKKSDLVVGRAGDGDVWDSEGVAGRVRKVTLDVFATDDSASVQVRVSWCKFKKKLYLLESTTRRRCTRWLKL